MLENFHLKEVISQLIFEQQNLMSKFWALTSNVFW